VGAGEFAARCDRVDEVESESVQRPCRHRDRYRTAQFDDRGGYQPVCSHHARSFWTHPMSCENPPIDGTGRISALLLATIGPVSSTRPLPKWKRHPEWRSH
jgi:hypothetical protein